MARIYVSATYADLKEYRDAVYRILRKLGHDVIAMEDYVATDTYPLHKCLADVAACDVYIGLIGWRYGYIPDKDNPENKSITELEYRQAGIARLPRLMFLNNKNASWPDEFKDSVTGEGEAGKRIAAFRTEVEREKLVSHFTTSEQLAGLVSVAVQQNLKTKRKSISAIIWARIGKIWPIIAKFRPGIKGVLSAAMKVEVFGNGWRIAAS